MLSLLLAAILAIAFDARADFSGRVVGVVDGDTLDVLDRQKTVRVRLARIDAPERGQAFGTRSRQALAALTFNRAVTVRTSGTDRYGRVIGTIHTEGLDVNAEMIRQGMAWVYPTYRSDASILLIEHEARAARRGLWTDPSPIPPWEYRRQRRS